MRIGDNECVAKATHGFCNVSHIAIYEYLSRLLGRAHILRIAIYIYAVLRQYTTYAWYGSCQNIA
jgi:hypothetical protein